MSQWLVIGLGNSLYGDEGVGLEVIKQLPQSAKRRCLEGGLGGLTLLPFALAAERVTLVDAIEAELEPGALVHISDNLQDFLSKKQVPTGLHGHSSSEFLHTLLKMAPDKPISLVGIQIKSANLGDALSPEASQAITEAVRVIENERHPD